MFYERDLQYNRAVQYTYNAITNWALVPRGALVWLDADNFGLHNLSLFEQVDKQTGNATLSQVRAIYDFDQDQFIYTRESLTGQLPLDACKCDMGQGYVACNCIGKATDGPAILQWFRDHGTTEIAFLSGGETFEQSLSNFGTEWWEWPRCSTAKIALEANASDFFRLNC